MKHSSDELESCQVSQRTYAYLCNWLSDVDCREIENHITNCTFCKKAVTTVSNITAVETSPEAAILDAIYDTTFNIAQSTTIQSDHQQQRLAVLKPICTSEGITLRYLAGELSIERNNIAQQHLADCDVCQQTVSLFARTLATSEKLDEQQLFDDIQEKSSAQALQTIQTTLESKNNQIKQKLINKRWHSPRKLLAIAATIIIMVATMVSLKIVQTPKNDDTADNQDQQLAQTIDNLRQLTRNIRPNELRISGIEYTHYQAKRGYSQEDRERILSLIASLALIDVKNANTETYLTLGHSLIAIGEYQLAIDKLRLAATRSPQNAVVLSDLAVAKLASGDVNGALASLNQALAIDPINLEALFNRALVYKQLQRIDQAQTDWQRYLTLDTKSQWAGEVKQNISASNN